MGTYAYTLRRKGAFKLKSGEKVWPLSFLCRANDLDRGLFQRGVNPLNATLARGLKSWEGREDECRHFYIGDVGVEGRKDAQIYRVNYGHYAPLSWYDTHDPVGCTLVGYVEQISARVFGVRSVKDHERIVAVRQAKQIDVGTMAISGGRLPYEHLMKELTVTETQARSLCRTHGIIPDHEGWKELRCQPV